MKTPWWFLSQNLMAWMLIPVSWIYFLFGKIVFLFRKKNSLVSRRPVICVGNILAGGVGKTPIVRAIANHFDSPIVMRGYKKNNKTGNIGDEATMLARSGLIVHVGNRRVNISLLNNQDDDTPIVMDDGLQNPTINKDVKLVVFDEGLGVGNGLLLPAGPLRQPKSVLKNADAIVVIRNKNAKTDLKLPDNVPVFYATNHTVSPYDEDEKLVAFAGIGYPKKFFDSLQNVVARRSFPDHYQYNATDIENLFALADKKGAKLITTEKDWVRLPIEIRDKIKYARLDTVIENRFYDWLKEKIEYANFKKAS